MSVSDFSESSQEAGEFARPSAASQIAGMVFAVILLDAEGKIAEANHAAESLLGQSSKRLFGRNITEIIGDVDARIKQRLNIVDSALVARDVIISAGEIETRVNLTISPLTQYPGWRVVTLSEISHEDNPDDSSLIGTIAAPSILAHEIKNPLSAIRGAGQLVARKLPHRDKSLARMITDEVDRIARLIDRMQQLGSRTTDPAAPCNLHEAIRSAIVTVRTAVVSDIQIVEEFDPSLPPALVNRDALEQVLINLLSNACDAAIAHDITPRVTVQTRFVSGLAFNAIRLGRSVRLPIEITVSDNGAGVPIELRNHVFEPFVSSKKSGQGLGLALVRKLVQDMDGRISHERDRKKNLTHFRIHLPQAAPFSGENKV